MHNKKDGDTTNTSDNKYNTWHAWVVYSKACPLALASKFVGQVCQQMILRLTFS